MLTFLAASIVAAGQTFTCTPTHVWDGDGPIWCAEGPHVRLSGIAAREMDGTCRTSQPCPDASPTEARDALVDLLGGARGRNSTGHIAVAGPRMTCRSEGSAGGEQDNSLVPPANRRGPVVRHDPHAHGPALGSLLERPGLPMNADLHLRGRLERGRVGLVLRADGGGTWELDAGGRAHRLVGQEVEVVGQRAGFNGVACEQVWPAGTPRPRQSRVRIEYLLAGGLVAYGVIAFLMGLVGYFR